MKMEKPILQVVRFDAADVIATSGGCGISTIAGNWSEYSYQATRTETLGPDDDWNIPYTSTLEDGNTLDGEKTANRNFLTVDNWYHHDKNYVKVGGDEEQYYLHYENWVTCTDPSHHCSN